MKKELQGTNSRLRIIGGLFQLVTCNLIFNFAPWKAMVIIPERGQVWGHRLKIQGESRSRLGKGEDANAKAEMRVGIL
jgi:hypothetical protein